MQDFWISSNKDPDTGFKLAQLSSGLILDETTWTLISDIIKNNQGHYYCGQALITDALTSHLQTTTPKQAAVYQNKVNLQNMATISCWNKMIPALKTTLKSLPANESVGLYSALNSLKQLNESETDLWLTRYLLQKPKVGQLFNHAWNRIKILGQDYNRRQAVLNNLTTLNHLPDESFALNTKAITSHFNRYFPEYITVYAKTCLKYLEGQAIFEFGNPTPACDKLFNKKNESILSKSLRARFQKAKRL